MTTMTVTEARKSLYSLVDETNSSHQPVHILGKRGGAVLIGEDDWSAIEEMLFLTSIPKMQESIVEGLNTLVEDCVEELEW
jgi:antitoxin YefM